MVVQRTGFTELSRSGGASNEYRVNIIFVHGLRGHPQHTWESDREADKDTAVAASSPGKTPGPTSPESIPASQDAAAPSSQSLFWPEEYLTQDIPSARVWTYGYDADVGGMLEANNQNDVSRHGSDLAVQLESDVDNEYPILFVAHGLGGIVVKDAMNRSEHCRSRTKLVVFLGTPHRESPPDGWSEIVPNLATLTLQDTNENTIKAPEVDGEVLDDIHAEFETIVHRHNIKIHSFPNLSVLKEFQHEVVDDASSKLDLPQNLETVETVDADLGQMARCSGRDDPQYRAIVGVLNKFLQSGALDDLGSTKQQDIQDVQDEQKVASPPGPQEMAEAGVGGLPPDGANLPRHHIPLPKNRGFVGRQAALDTLKDLLFNKQCKKVAVVGLGGVGKTQVALHVAYWAMETKPDISVFWVPALSNEGFLQACADIVLKLSIPSAVPGEDPRETVRRHLSSEAAGKWLLVIDNADDEELLYGHSDRSGGLGQYLPDSSDGLTLFTTRFQRVAVSVARNNVVHLDQMEPQDAKNFLQESLIQKESLRDDVLVSKLLARLTYHPLAIAQAVAYINEKKVPASKYLDLLGGIYQDLAELLSKEFQDDTRYPGSQNAVVAAWCGSFNQIRKSDSAAAELLSFMSCIKPREIPQSLLPSLGSMLQQEDAIGTLCAYAFLTRRGDSDVFDMHPLVHFATRVWIQKDGRSATTIEKATRHMATVFPASDYSKGDKWMAYLPHARMVLQHSRGLDTKERFQLCFSVGRSLTLEGHPKAAIKYLEETYQWTSTHLPKNSRGRLTSEHKLAVAYYDDGQATKAIEMLEDIVAIDETILPETHPDRLAAQHSLARAYRLGGQATKAVEMLEKIVAIDEATLPEAHPDRLTSQHSLARAYRKTGQVARAIKLFEHVVAFRKTTLDETDPDRLLSEHQLARAYRNGGQLAKAIELLEHVVATEKRAFDETDTDLLVSQYELALAYHDDGQVAKAIGLLEHVVAVEKMTLKKTDPNLLASQYELALAYRDDGQEEKATELLEHCQRLGFGDGSGTARSDAVENRSGSGTARSETVENRSGSEEGSPRPVP